MHYESVEGARIFAVLAPLFSTVLMRERPGVCTPLPSEVIRLFLRIH